MDAAHAHRLVLRREQHPVADMDAPGHHGSRHDRPLPGKREDPVNRKAEQPVVALRSRRGRRRMQVPLQRAHTRVVGAHCTGFKNRCVFQHAAAPERRDLLTHLP
ncbi:hypothetical protein D3C72_1276660 [compost metagenome]